MSIDAADRQLSQDNGRAAFARRLASLPGGLWVAVVVGALVVAEFLFVVGKRGLSWDEIVYITQINRFAYAAPFVAARARGITLITAPVTLLTSSLLVLRSYLALLSGLALLGALWVWHRVLPWRLLAIAALLFSSLWIVQYYGPRAMPDMWLAVSGLAAVGFFNVAVRTGRKRELAGLAASLAVATLMRPSDAVFLAVPLAVAAIFVPGWRNWRLTVALVAGLVAGGLEWAIEAYARWGGIGQRLHYAVAMQSGAGLHAGLWDELRALDGPVICRRTCHVGWSDPKLTIWWLAIPLLVALGLIAARRAGRLGPAVLATLAALAVSAQYLVLINYAAPRFLIPAYALLSLPIAEGADWMLANWVLAGRHLLIRVAVGAACVALLLAQAVSQHLVLTRNVIAAETDDQAVGAKITAAGISPPCEITGYQYIPYAYYTHCRPLTQVPPAGTDRGATIVYIIKQGDALPPSLRTWRRVPIWHANVNARVRPGGVIHRSG